MIFDFFAISMPFISETNFVRALRPKLELLKAEYKLPSPNLIILRSHVVDMERFLGHNCRNLSSV